jgi:hypothetical protein
METVQYAMRKWWLMVAKGRRNPLSFARHVATMCTVTALRGGAGAKEAQGVRLLVYTAEQSG